MAKYCVVYNQRAGFLGSQKLLEDLFSAKKLDTKFIKCNSKVHSQIETAIREGCKVIAAAGGDGTVNTVVRHVVNTDLTLAVIPIGTYNHFARDLKIPLEVDKAIAAIARGKTIRIDTARLNDRLFVNLSSVGLYPRLVRARARTAFLGKLLSGFLGMLLSASWPLVHDLAFSVDGKRFSRKTSLVVVSNNSYQVTRTGFTNRQELDDGWLWLYIVKSRRPWQIVRVAWRAFRGQTDAERDFEEYTAKRVNITHRKRRRKTAVALDGEVVHLTSPLIYSIEHKALKVIVGGRS